MSKALYRKYRSKSLGEIVGQNHVTDILTRALAQGKIAHAYLLTGPRGVGKTSIARILAHEINALTYADDSTHLDIIEIDAASNNGVEDIRDLREKVQVAPVSAAKKVYIIDEVHMLSKAAFNALLKTLEEPPEHAVFILATTDIEKLPPTIISRTQRFHFRSITPEDAVKHLRHIADSEKITIDDDALRLIATRGDGSFRDSISLLDQLSSLASGKEGITYNLALTALGLAPEETVSKLIEAHLAKDLSAVVQLLRDAEQSGVQSTVITHQIIQAIRRDIIEKPQLLGLLDALLDVAKSSQPSIKLLTVLAGNGHAPKARSAALSAPTPVISMPVAELQKQTRHESPPAVRPKIVAHSSAKASKDTPAVPEKKREDFETGTLDWDAFIQYTREHYVAIYSVLSKCGHEEEDATIKLYTGNAFYKKKLDDAKYRLNIADSLIATGAGDWSIETIPTPPPPKDSQAAAVAAIMGGGEEVSVEQ